MSSTTRLLDRTEAAGQTNDKNLEHAASPPFAKTIKNMEYVVSALGVGTVDNNITFLGATF